MPLWLQILIIASPLAGILYATFVTWLDFKDKQARIDTTTSELEHTVAAQQETLKEMTRRLQNLEAIVTSQVWDTLHDGNARGTVAQHAFSRSAPPLDTREDEEEPSDADRAAHIARRLKT